MMFELDVDLRCRWLCQELYIHGYYEPDETAFFKRIIRPGMVVCDIGANIGYFTTLFASKAGPLGK